LSIVSDSDVADH